ncbi:MAG: hypothetical protein R2715_21015 [Ilumatobacteraceae bacterium]
MRENGSSCRTRVDIPSEVRAIGLGAGFELEFHQVVHLVSTSRSPAGARSCSAELPDLA